MHRYTNKRDDKIFSWMFRILTEDEVKSAEILGKAMRLGAMLWVSDDVGQVELYWDENTADLQLSLPGAASALYGEVSQARLQSLASALEAQSYDVFG